jgi:hypothetical protein
VCIDVANMNCGFYLDLVLDFWTVCLALIGRYRHFGISYRFYLQRYVSLLDRTFRYVLSAVSSKVNNLSRRLDVSVRSIGSIFKGK